jgi:phosphodiesterase/alkaline phosphatase D-like protein
MGTSRRSFLSLGGAAAGAALVGPVAGCRDDPTQGEPIDSGLDPAPSRSPEPPPWEPPGPEDAVAFPFGVQAGDATAGSVVLSVRARGLVELSIRVVRADGTTWTDARTLDALPVDDEGVVQVVLDDLEPDTAYAWAAGSVDGQAWSRAGRFRTALGEDGWRQVIFGATSCLGGNDPWPNLTHAADAQLDFFCLLGDTVYCDGAESLEDFRLFWREALATGGLLDLSASTSLIATWDDHELTNNDEWDELSDETYAAGLRAFRESLPQSPGPGGSGIWRSLRWGDVLEVFVLDCRGERAGDRYVSDAQLAWLQDGLAASGARFKIILNSVPITDETAFVGAAGALDRWQGYPEQRDALLGFVTDNDIGGVVWVSGDHHFAMVAHVDPRGGVAWDQMEVLVGPSGSFLNPAADLFAGDEQYPLMFAAWNYTRFTCDPARGTVEVAFIGDTGETLADFTLAP